MKTLSVRLPEPLAGEIESESRRRRISKSEVVRERLRGRARVRVHEIADLIGSVQALPADLSARVKRYLKPVSAFERNAQSTDRAGKWRKAAGAAASEGRVVLRDFRPSDRMDRCT